MMTAVRKLTRKRLSAINGKGYPIGEDHHRAILTDHEVDLVFDLRDEGLSLGRIAKAMEVSKSCIAKILSGRTRSQIAAAFIRRVPIACDAVENLRTEDELEPA